MVLYLLCFQASLAALQGELMRNISDELGEGEVEMEGKGAASIK